MLRKSMIELLHLFILSALGVAQPVFEVLSRNAEFFVVRRSSPSDIILFTVILCLLIPGFMAFLEILAAAFSNVVRKGIHAFWITFLISAIALRALHQTGTFSGIAILVAIPLFSAGVTAGYYRFPSQRTFVSFLSPALLVVPGLFLMHPTVSRILTAKQEPIVLVKTDAKTPVVLIIFDELPVMSLMDREHLIDSARYPNFASFSQNATWFRNATTVSDSTTRAVTAILTGMYPVKSIPTIIDYPNNLFTILGASYEMTVFESLTRLCPREIGGLEMAEHSLTKRMQSLLSDLSVVYLHMILPPDLAQRLPMVTETWGDFWEQKQSRHYINKVEDITDERLRAYEAFLRSVKPSDQPSLYYLHLMLPHGPCRFLPSGKEYDINYPLFGRFALEGRTAKDFWKQDEWAVVQGFQRHLLQLAFADKLLGKIMNKLMEAGLYDDSLIVITSDHGVCFRPGEPRRGITESNYPDILPVPLMVKSPHQTTGAVDDRNIETIDILPTIADVLGIHVSWQMDGHSVFDSSAPQRNKKKLIATLLNKDRGQTLEFAPEFSVKYRALERQLSFFGSKTPVEQVFRIGAGKEWIGRTLKELELEEIPGIKIEINNRNYFEQVDLGSSFIPALISGRVSLNGNQEQRLVLGIVMNGTLSAVTRTFPLQEKLEGFGAMVPESAFRAGRNEVAVVVLR